MLAEITTYVADVRRRILTQYLKPKIAGLLEVFAGQAQELESALWELLLQTSIGYFGPPIVGPPIEPTSPRTSGIWLDYLGARVGEARDGEEIDGQYATWIATRIRANRSSGSLPDLIGVLALPMDGHSTPVITELYPAGLEIDIGHEITAELAERVARYLRVARSAGVGISLLFNEENDALTFTFSSTDAPEASAFQGFGDSSNAATGGEFAGAIHA